jgi:Ni,Fe-hydrogenase maturation factor
VAEITIQLKNVKKLTLQAIFLLPLASCLLPCPFCPLLSALLPNVNSIAVHQLTPELVEPLTSVDIAIFVDAYSANEGQEVQVCPLEPAASGWTIGHSSMPRALLAIALALYNYYPPAWLVMIPGKDFELGNTLSSLAERGMEQALEVIIRLIKDKKPIEVAELGFSLHSSRQGD